MFISLTVTKDGLKFNPDMMKKHDHTNNKNLDTVVNRKDENNTLIVHSQDGRRMLKNTIIKSKARI